MNDNLNDVSNILGDLKNMAVDMGEEITMQNQQIDRMQEKADEQNISLKAANERTNKLLGK